jgi:TPR repeat protein
LFVGNIHYFNNYFYTQAVMWFRRAAQQGNTDAQKELGCLGVAWQYQKLLNF